MSNYSSIASPQGHKITGGTLTTIPATARRVWIAIEGQTVRIRTDGSTPSASVGFPLTAGTILELTGAEMVAAEFYQTTNGATVHLWFRE